MINSKFYLAPLAPFVAPEPYFYILVLSKKQSKLFRADRHAIEYIDLPEIPNGIEDVVHLEEKDDQTLWRTGSSGAGGGANYHGIGGGKPDEKDNIALYLEEVDETLWQQRLSEERVPLVLAGVDYLLPIYRSVTQYRNIYNHALTGSYEHEDVQKIHERAKEILGPYFEEAGKKALMAYANQSATDLTSIDPAIIIPAAHYGRVATLFALPDHHLWGTFDEAKNILTVHPRREEGDECLVNATVLKTLLQGGQVYFLGKDEMPANSPMAAQMRYEA